MGGEVDENDEKWLKKVKSQQGSTLVELLVAVAIVGLIVPGLFAAFQVFIKVPAQLSATLSSIGSVSHASEWISKDVSVAQSVRRSSDPDGYVTFAYIDGDDQEHVINYSYVSDEKSIIRQETLDGTTTTFTVATGIEAYNRADLNVVTFQTGDSAPVRMVVGNLLAIYWAGADPREREASPYTVVRQGSEEPVGKVFNILSLGLGNLVVNGWTLYFRDLHVNGDIQFEGGGNDIYGTRMSAGGDISFRGSQNIVFTGDIQANGLIEVGGGGGIGNSFGGDILAGEIDIKSQDHSVSGDLYANGDISIKNYIVIGEFDGVNHIPGDITSLGTISMGTNNTIHGQLIQKDGDFIGIDLSPSSGNEVWGVPPTDIVSDLEAIDPLPTHLSPIEVTIDELIAEAGNVFYFSGSVDLTEDTEDDDGNPIWDEEYEVLNPGIYYAPDGKIEMRIAEDGSPISGNVTFIAEKIELKQDAGFTSDPSYTLSSYIKGILFWATNPGNAIEMTGLNGLSLQGIIYAPDGDIVLKGFERDSEFILSAESSLVGNEITLQAQGTLKFPSIELDPLGGPPGTEVTVSGSGFHSNSQIDIYFGADEVGPFLLITDADGRFPATFFVPGSAVVGFHTVKAIDEDGNWAAALFAVTP